MVKGKSCSASNGVFWVRILVEVLKELRKGHPNGDGNRLEAGRAFFKVPCGFNSRSFRSLRENKQKRTLSSREDPSSNLFSFRRSLIYCLAEGAVFVVQWFLHVGL